MADGYLVLNQTLFGEPLKNVLVVSNLVADAQEVQALADSIRADFDLGPHDQLTTEWSLDSITAVFDPGPGQYSHESSFTLGSLLGTNANQALPNQDCLLVSTSRLGPAPNRGRIYFSGLTEGALDNGEWSTAAKASFENMVESWATSGIPGQVQTSYLRIGRRDNLGNLTITAPVEAWIARNIPATQRRRRRGA